MAQGLFNSALGNLRQEEKDEELRLQRLAQMDPTDQSGYAALSASRMAGQGLGRAIAGMAGKDPRTDADRLKAAQQAMGDMEDADVSTPEGVDAYYRNVINVLRKNGLPGEAHAAAQEWHKFKGEQADRKLKEDELKRKQAADAAKAANQAEANRIKATRNAQLAQQGLPEFIQIIDRIEKTEDPITRKRMIDYANAQIESKKKGITFEDAGDRIIVRDKATGTVLGTDKVGEKPVSEKPLSAADRLKKEKGDKALASAYQAAMVALQTDYKAAADLYNHPGLDDLIGPWSGIAAERKHVPGQTDLIREGAFSRLSPAGEEALALFNQVQGGAFVRALQDLKTAGGGSTGLGQVTEVEGQKITDAKASLFPRQQPTSFRRALGNYISVIEQSANILGNKAKEDGLEPIGLNIVELTGPQRGVPQTRAPTKPRTVAPSAPAVDGDRVRVRRPDGMTGTIPRAKLEEYKGKGYTEIK